MDDSRIISMLFERNDKALGIINDKYGNLLYRLSDNILHCRKDSAECVNDTYLAVWNNIPPHSPNPLVAFICKITRNLSLKKLREKTHKSVTTKRYLFTSLNSFLLTAPLSKALMPVSSQE